MSIGRKGSVRSSTSAPPGCITAKGSYEAQEALPVSYAGSRPQGEQTHRACLLTLFHRKPRVDCPTFIERWHVGHT